MDGLLIIDKPAGMTSHDVVNRIRRILKTKRVGHTGTLDPFATGVLVMLVGRATRLAQFLDKDEKEYEAVVRFGYETDTGDRTGMRIAESSEIHLPANWNQILSRFRGKIMQTPPMYSAKKIEGKKLYELARKGVAVERKAVPVIIYDLEIIDSGEIRDPRSAVRIRVVCSAGTYIRTLAEDIGRAAEMGAHLEELRRTRAGQFKISNALTIAELEKAKFPEEFLIPMGKALPHLPEIILTENRIEKTRSGLSTSVEGLSVEDGAAVRIMDERGGLAAVGIYEAAEKNVRPKVVLI